MFHLQSSYFHRKFLTKLCSVVIILCFTVQSVFPSSVSAQSISQLNLPQPGFMIQSSSAFAPVMLRGLTLDSQNPLQMDFIVNAGDTALTGKDLEEESLQLVRYFLAALTIPEDQLWVNLSPYEKDRIIPKVFGDTEMGRDLLAQDYVLKQLTSSLMYPESELGKKFWDKVYQETQAKFGTSDIPLDTFNKVWILPKKAKVYEHNGSVFIVDSELKVMLEEDFAAMQKTVISSTAKNLDRGFSSAPVQNDDSQKALVMTQMKDIIREIIIPAIEQEVNHGEHFAKLRQVFNALILATWYKKNLKSTFLSQVYVNQGKTVGVDVDDKTVNLKIYDEYLKAFKAGAYDLIKEDYDSVSQEMVARKYFSGGADLTHLEENNGYGEFRSPVGIDAASLVGGNFNLKVGFENQTSADSAMMWGVVSFFAFIAVLIFIVKDDGYDYWKGEWKSGQAPGQGLKNKDQAMLNVVSKPAQEFAFEVTSGVAEKLTRFGLRGIELAVKKIMSDHGESFAVQQHELVIYLKTIADGIEGGANELLGVAELIENKDSQSGEITEDDVKKIIKAGKNTADSVAKRIFQQIANDKNAIMRVRVSEGIADGVEESFMAHEVVLPIVLESKRKEVVTKMNGMPTDKILNFEEKDYPVVDVIVDVIEGTDQFVINSGDKTLENILELESGATSTVVVGEGVQNLGNAPDIYAGHFVTNFESEEMALKFNAVRVEVDGQQFSLKDPELYARKPEAIMEYLKFLAQIRGQQLSELQEEIVVMKRPREAAFLAALKKAQESISGLKITEIKAGTVAHGLKAAMTQDQFVRSIGAGLSGAGFHKTMITIGGSAEAYMVLAIAGALKGSGAVAGMRVYSGDMNGPKGQEAQDQSLRYQFSDEEKADIENLRPEDAKQIIGGEKLFTEQDVRGSVYGAFSFISTNGVFHQPGTLIHKDGSAETYVLTIGRETTREKVAVRIQRHYSKNGNGANHAMMSKQLQILSNLVVLLLFLSSIRFSYLTQVHPLLLLLGFAVIYQVWNSRLEDRAMMSLKNLGRGKQKLLKGGESFKKGGIDLNPAMFESFDVEKSDSGMLTEINGQPIAEIRNNIQGLRPFVIKVTPMAHGSMLKLLGLNESGAEPLADYADQKFLIFKQS